MPNVRRLTAAVLTLAVLFFASVPVMAQEEEETTDTTIAQEDAGTSEEGATDTTAAEGASGPVAPPAVSVPDSAPEEELPDWTYRYLIPTLIVLAAIVVIMTTVQYFLRVVRNRYKVVE